MPLHIAVADDHGAIRIGLKYIIQTWKPDTKISFAECFDDLITLLETSIVDLVILDINLPGSDNFQTVELIKEKRARSRVLIFSAYEDELYALRYLDAGADGYLHKNATEAEIEQALNTLLIGGRYSGNGIKDIVLERRVQKGRVQHNPLLESSNRNGSLSAARRWIRRKRNRE